MVANHEGLDDTRPVALIGMGCRFPGSDSPEAFWQSLLEGRDAITASPRADRCPGQSGEETQGIGDEAMGSGAYLADVASFDAEFFGMSPREAASVDPQHRLLLEVAWESIEHAAINPDTLRGSRAGVFVGISTNDYGLLTNAKVAPIGPYTGIGNAKSLAANRISYALDWRGPSVSIDAACASSLVAVHVACRALQQNECDLALAGGVNLVLTPSITTSFRLARMLSPRGRCRSFDHSADGYVRGEGCGLVVLKRLSDARRDGDIVWATMLGSAVNHVGRSAGITVPDKDAQVDVMQAAMSAAGVAGEDIDFVEAHGTGTRQGDPVELEALAEAMGRRTKPDARLIVGAVKANIGHLEAAAGVAGLIKAIYVLRTGLVPPQLHFEHFPTAVGPVDERLTVATSIMPLPQQDRPAHAGVSAFGFGGTNCHVVLRASLSDPDGGAVAETPPGTYTLVLTARTARDLCALAVRYRDHLETDPTSDLADLCFTAAIGRARFPREVTVVAESRAHLVAQLQAIIDNPTAVASPVSATSGGAERSAHRSGRRTPSLPTYPFQRTRHWLGATASETATAVPIETAGKAHSRPLRSIGPTDTTWEVVLDVDRDPSLAHHRVTGALVVPGVVLLDKIAAAAHQRTGKRVGRFLELRYRRVLILPEHGPLRAEVFFIEDSADRMRFEVRTPGERVPWHVNVDGVVMLG
jgi:acyl transferase domain-containing protein